MRNPFARVAKRETTRPSLKERATGLKATAARVMKRRPAAPDAPSPALVGMVAEWERLLDIENTGELTDEQMSPICHARYRLHAQICAYPAASIADLAAKLPLFREEIIANEPSDPRRPTMDYQSWCGIVSDLEAVGAMPSPEKAGTAPLAGTVSPGSVSAGKADGAGLVTYTDAAGRVHRKTVAEWIGYAAARLDRIARGELNRALDAACNDDPGQDANAIHDRLRKELRIDALHDLAVRSDKVFEVCKEYAVGHRWHAVGNEADAELLALGREFDVIHAEWVPAAVAQEQAEAKVHALYQDLKDRRGWTAIDAYEASWAEPGLIEIAEHGDAATGRMDGMQKEILALPARTLDGLAVKARAAIPAFWPRGRYQQDAALGDDEDWTERHARSLIDECLHLAGVNWTGRRFHDADAAKSAR